MLRHDKALHTVRLQSHLKDVPDYIIPPTLRRLASSTMAKKNKPSKGGSGDADKACQEKSSRKEKVHQKRKANSLFSYEFESFQKKSKK